MEKAERKRLFISFFIPFLFIVLLWIILLLDFTFHLNLYQFGVQPLTLSGLRGIIFSPLIHAGFDHLMSNTFPLLFLAAATIYFYRTLAYKIFFWIWVLDGIGVWLIGRDSYHIGASGIIYGLASFVMISGFVRNNRALLALSLAVAFYYGGIVFGMAPTDSDISWEAHLVGFAAGIFLAIYYRHHGPEDEKLPEWMNEPDEISGESGDHTSHLTIVKGPEIDDPEISIKDELSD
jgi:membrane associated rhomboid family serine protease